MSFLTESTCRWADQASLQQIKDKIEEYELGQGNTSPRDAEARSQILSILRRRAEELAADGFEP